MISIIIPIYNSEKFLQDAIKSTLNQTYKDYEVILVDDGSTDGSSLICAFYCENYPNFKYIYSENSGVTNARKLGLELSQGEYILFLDSDDMLLPSCLESMIVHMKIGIDAVVSETKYSALFTAEEYIYKILNGFVPAGINGKLYRRALFDERTLLLPREINIGEDLIMNVKLALNTSGNISCINSALYYYRYNENSVIHKRKYSWSYESRFIEALNVALGDKKEKYINALMHSYFITIERLAINRIDLDWNNKYIKELLLWAETQKLSLKQKILLNVRKAKIAKYILAILRRLSIVK